MHETSSFRSSLNTVNPQSVSPTSYLKRFMTYAVV